MSTSFQLPEIFILINRNLVQVSHMDSMESRSFSHKTELYHQLDNNATRVQVHTVLICCPPVSRNRLQLRSNQIE